LSRGGEIPLFFCSINFVRRISLFCYGFFCSLGIAPPRKIRSVLFYLARRAKDKYPPTLSLVARRAVLYGDKTNTPHQPYASQTSQSSPDECKHQKVNHLESDNVKDLSLFISGDHAEQKISSLLPEEKEVLKKEF